MSLTGLTTDVFMYNKQNCLMYDHTFSQDGQFLSIKPKINIYPIKVCSTVHLNKYYLTFT